MIDKAVNACKLLRKRISVRQVEVTTTMLGEKQNQLPAGRKMGHYEILGLIGKGGMGEVYRALDTKLRREVAIKVLPATFARDPDRLARFRREAQLLASLNHENIATIHGLEQFESVHFLVMELVPGETLADRVRVGPLEVEETLRICGQIAAALESAHDKGVIHRDLKPANVKVTPADKVKVLDFGLAKAFAADPTSDVYDSNSPTLSASPSIPGAIIGTAAYMSPEQARGKVVDKRTDIWAFGCVLYELLTAKQVFAGETVTDILGAVLHKEPDWTLLPETTPASIRVLLRRCLEKEARRRFRDAADVRIEIEDALNAPLSAELAVVKAPFRSVWGRGLIWALAGAMVAAAVAAIAIFSKPPAQQPVSRVTITLPLGQHLASLDQPAIAISPDGKNLVYVAVQSSDVAPASGRPLGQRDAGATGTQQLFLRPLDSLESKPIAGTEGATGPFFSPDGQWIGFFASGKLKKVSVNGGSAITLASAPNPGGASWSSQGTLALQPIAAPQGLQQVSEEGGTPEALTRLVKGDYVHRWPEFLPGGKAVLFAGSATFGAWSNAQIAVQPVGSSERKNLAQGGTQPRYAPTGHLLYLQSGTLMAAPFDSRGLVLTGAAVPALEGVMQSLATGAAQYSISSTGTLAYLAGGATGGQSHLVWVSRNGEEQSIPAPTHSYEYPRVSPDGRRVAVAIGDRETQTWVYDVARGTLNRLTFEGNVNTVPTWSPDGKRIAFRSTRTGAPGGNMFWQASDGSGGDERLTTSENLQGPSSFSPDGQLLAFQDNNPDTGRDIWVLNLKDRKAQPFLKTPYEDTAPKFSPDGKWLAYSSDESGRREIYVQPYPGPGGKWQISPDGGQEPVWNPKGGELFYRIESKMMAVDVQVGQVSRPARSEDGSARPKDRSGDLSLPGFSAGKPRMLFEGPYLPTTASFPYYDVSPDGQRFLMLKPVESQTSAPTQINVVLNWFEELKKKVPTGK